MALNKSMSVFLSLLEFILTSIKTREQFTVVLDIYIDGNELCSLYWNKIVIGSFHYHVKERVDNHEQIQRIKTCIEELSDQGVAVSTFAISEPFIDTMKP